MERIFPSSLNPSHSTFSKATDIVWTTFTANKKSVTFDHYPIRSYNWWQQTSDDANVTRHTEVVKFVDC